MAELADAHGSAPVTSVTKVNFERSTAPGLSRRAEKGEKQANADMAELADAHGSGPCEGYFIQVQVLLSAPSNNLENHHFLGVVLFLQSGSGLPPVSFAEGLTP